MFKFWFILQLDFLNKFIIIQVSYFMLSQSSPHAWDFIIKKKVFFLIKRNALSGFSQLAWYFHFGKDKKWCQNSYLSFMLSEFFLFTHGQSTLNAIYLSHGTEKNFIFKTYKHWRNRWHRETTYMLWIFSNIMFCFKVKFVL